MSGEARRYYATSGEAARTFTITSAAGSAGADAGDSAGSAAVGDAGGEASLRVLPEGGRFMVSFGERSAVGFAERRDSWWHVELEGRAYRIRVDDERTHRLRELTEEMAPAAGPPELRAPMPGLVIRVAVTAGEDVEAGDSLVVMEAMKMENELRAESRGRVAGVHVDAGSTVDRDALLVTFESVESP